MRRLDNSVLADFIFYFFVEKGINLIASGKGSLFDRYVSVVPFNSVVFSL